MIYENLKVRPIAVERLQFDFETEVGFETIGCDDLQDLGLAQSHLSLLSKDSRNKVMRNFDRLKNNRLLPNTAQLSDDVLIDSQNGVYWQAKDEIGSFKQMIKFRQYANSLFDLSDSPITIVSDQCLYDISGIIATDSQSNEYAVTNPYSAAPGDIQQIRQQQSTTLYEMESVKRQTRLIQYMVSAGREIDFIDATPEVNYHLYLVDQYNNGTISTANLIRYFSLISQRSQALHNMRAKRVGEVNSITKRPPLFGIEQFIKDLVEKGEKIDLETVMEFLRSADPIWQTVLDFKKPETLMELNSKTSYMVEEIRPVLENPESVSLIIKNPRQEKIFTLTEAFARHYFEKTGIKLRLMSMYPLELIHYRAKTPKQSTLYNIPARLTFSDRKIVTKLFR